MCAAPRLSAEHRKALEKKFSEMDKNGDGQLGLQEIDTFLRKANPALTSREVQILFEQIDSNGDFQISFDEFVDFLIKPSSKEDAGLFNVAAPPSRVASRQPSRRPSPSPDGPRRTGSNPPSRGPPPPPDLDGKYSDGALKAGFKKWDKNGDGKLNFQEMALLLRQGTPNLSDRELEFLFSTADTDGDRKINFSEFAEWINSSSRAVPLPGFATLGR
mmetsp:Transcript_64931/g.145889  ORF Transcript_64931/g.145889 Transcript_64931/m.145889 type:complete len:217 (-) Transcript_64931:89-739(-)